MTNAVENIFSNGEEYEEDVPMYNYEDEGAFSDVDYDSDDCEANLKKRRHDEEDESEDEIWEDEEDDEEISNEIRLQLLREKSKKQLEGLSVLEGRLNWLEKVPVIESDIDIDDNDYPVLGAIKPKEPKKEPKEPKEKRVRSPNSSPAKYVPAACIKVKVGKKTYIEVEPVYCKAVKEGKPCAFGDRCKFSHDLPKAKIDYSTRLCNFIRNGEQCKFKGRCKYSHDIQIQRRKPSGSEQRKRGPKPMCRNGLKCDNRKCTFTHPPGHKKAPETPRTRTPNSSPRPPLETVDKKFLLCKNMFKVDDSIKTVGGCRFGDSCIFAHSIAEVEKKVKDNLVEFECAHKECKGVNIQFITKKDKDGKDRKTRRYKNSGIRKCFKIHQKERVSDFIVRTQSLRV